MNDENFKVTMTCYDKTVTVDRNRMEVSIFEVIEDIVTCLYGLSFSENQIIRGFSEYIKEKNEIH